MQQAQAIKIPMFTKTHFVEFARRDGIAREHAASEFDNILNLNGYARTLDSYITVRRIGQPFTLTRVERISLHLTFQNAMNHASSAK
jgi:hypothetical protein